MALYTPKVPPEDALFEQELVDLREHGLNLRLFHLRKRHRGTNGGRRYARDGLHDMGRQILR